MGSVREELNVGQLCREHYGEEARLIGFGTHTGTVAAATDWDGPMEVKRINPSRPDSYERQCHDSGRPRFLLDLMEGANKAAREALMEPRLERFIRSEEHTSELQSLMRISYAVFCLKKKNKHTIIIR